MNNAPTITEPRVSTLVTGIVHDVEELVKQQLALFRAEVERDVRKTKEGILPLALGVWVALLGSAGLCLMLVYLLQWGTSWPVWGCYGLVSVLCLVVGGGLVYAGLKKFASFNPLPEESARALKENVQCLMIPK